MIEVFAVIPFLVVILFGIDVHRGLKRIEQLKKEIQLLKGVRK